MSQTPPESDVLVYDLAADTWRKVELPGVEVVQVATIGDRVAIVGLMPSEGPAPDGDRVLLRWLEPATGRVENGPDLAIAGEPTAVAAHGADGALTVAVRVSVPVPGPGGVSEGAPGVVATIEPGSSWYRRRALPDTSELPGRLGLGSRAPHLWEWTGDAVVAFELGSVALFDPDTGIARVDRPRPGEAGASIPTGFDAAQVWTGSEVLIWGGSSGGGAEAELATGARLRPSP
jgi:hypothetical protein